MQTMRNDEYEIYHTYQEGNKLAHVVKHNNSGSWGIHMFKDGKSGLRIGIVIKEMRQKILY